MDYLRKSHYKDVRGGTIEILQRVRNFNIFRMDKLKLSE